MLRVVFISNNLLKNCKNNQKLLFTQLIFLNFLISNFKTPKLQMNTSASNFGTKSGFFY
jgi:hypothetical protein